MKPRFELDEFPDESPMILGTDSRPPDPSKRLLVNADWDHAESEPLMLYVAEEPRVGLEFSYLGLDWRIVEYRDGWVAQLVVD